MPALSRHSPNRWPARRAFSSPSPLVRALVRLREQDPRGTGQLDEVLQSPPGPGASIASRAARTASGREEKRPATHASPGVECHGIRLGLRRRRAEHRTELDEVEADLLRARAGAIDHGVDLGRQSRRQPIARRRNSTGRMPLCHVRRVRKPDTPEMRRRQSRDLDQIA